jgi:hypothetical protein
MSDQEQTGESLAARYFRRIIYETHAPSSTRRVSGLEATLKGVKITDSRVKPPEVAVIPDDLTARINTARAAVRAVITEYTLGTRKPGVRLVAIRRQDDFFEKISAAVAEFNAVADEAEARWDEIHRFNRDFWRPRFGSDAEYERHVGSKLPKDAREFRRKFGVFIADEEPERELGELEDEVAAQFLRDCLENGQRLKEQLDIDLKIRPLEEVAEASRAAEEQLATGKFVSPATFTNLLAAVNRLKQCAAFSDPAALEAVNAMAAKIGKAVGRANTSKALGGTYTAAITPLKKVLAAAMADAAAECDRAVASQKEAMDHGRLAKGIDFIPPEEGEEDE